MSSIDELRRTLEQRADELHDAERHTRPTAVRARIRTVRRRRAGAVAVSAAAALVVATGTLTLVRGASAPEPAAPLFDGVPQSIEVHGFPYELSSTSVLENDGRLELDPDQVVSLVATGLGRGSATLFGLPVPHLDVALARVRGDEQVSAPVDVDSGLESVQVRLDGAPDGARVGLAVYEPTGDLAPGVAADGVVFRQRIADWTLDDAAFAAADGTAEVSARGTGELDLALYCRAERPGLWLHVVYPTGLDDPRRCSEYDWGAHDPGRNHGYLSEDRPGENAVSAYVTDGEDGTPATDVLFGVAIYHREVPRTEVLGEDVAPTVFEFAGRTWRLDEVRTMRSANERIEIDTSDGDLFFGYVVRADDSRFAWHGELDPGDMRGGGQDGALPQPASWGQGGILFAGDHYVIDAQLVGEDSAGAVVTYRPE